MKYYCIADPDTLRGFQLAGVEGRAVTVAGEAATALRDAMQDPGIGILILTDVVAAEIREQVDTIRLEHDRPLIVEIPGPEGPMPGRKTLRQLVQEAVGIRVGQEDS